MFTAQDQNTIFESYMNQVVKKLPLNEMAPPTELGGGSYDPSKIRTGVKGAPHERDYFIKPTPLVTNITDEKTIDVLIGFIINLVRDELKSAIFPGERAAFLKKLEGIISATLKKVGAKISGAGFIARMLHKFMIDHDLIKDEEGKNGKGRGGRSVTVDLSALGLSTDSKGGAAGMEDEIS